MMVTIPGYHLKSQLHESNSVFIYAAIREKDQKLVAIKLLKIEHPTLEEIAQFQHEYDLLKKLGSAHVAHAYSLEILDNYHAIILEFIDFPSLAETLRKKNKFELQDYMALAINITEVIEQIHRAHIIHKDINPSNILYDLNKKEMRVIDFGIAVDIPKERPLVVSPNFLAGTLPYLSPEQNGRMNREIDYRTDYYSLGVTLYQLLTGQLPFQSDDPLEVIHAHMSIIPKTPEELDVAIPKPLSDIIMKLLMKNPEERYQSSGGLLADLINCRDQLQMQGNILPFPLGEHDIFHHFRIPEKLYGRELEIKILLDTYERVMQGSNELLFVSGYSGIGKSSLVHEIYKPIVRNHGYFIKGKFEQFKHNVAYSALYQAVEELIKQILCEAPEKVAHFQKIVLATLGNNAQVMIDAIPLLENIIGKQPPVAQLGPTETLNRFTYVFQNFIQALSSLDHPLVLFLDDMQWADFSSLKILEEILVGSEYHNLFIIGAYRGNEMYETHPLMMKIERLKKLNITCHSLLLGPLKINDVEQIVADTLHQEKEKIQALAEVLYKKTGGNPFFLVQLLQTLYEEKLIIFDIEKNAWLWYLDKIKNKKAADNVIQLMVEKIHQLDPDIQKIISIAACIGNQFQVEWLDKISDESTEKIGQALQELLKIGFIFKLENAFLAFSFQFAHDRIQEAAHSLLDEQARKMLHLKIARLMLQNISAENFKNNLFNMVDHYNIFITPAVPTSIEAAEKKSIAELNMGAAKLAKSSASFDSALNYIEYALSCLDENSWDTDYNFTLSVYSEAIEDAYLNSKFEIMDNYADIALKKIKTIFDELPIIKIKALSNIAQGDQQAAITILLEALARLGIYFPKKPNLLQSARAVLSAKLKLLYKKLPRLLTMPEMTDPSKIAANILLTIVSSATFIARPDLFPLIVSRNIALSLRYGNTRQSAGAYDVYSVILCGVLGNIDNAYQLGTIALELSEKFNPGGEGETLKIIFRNYSFLKHWKEHLHTFLPQGLEVYQKLLDCGELEFAGYAILFYIMYSYFAGIHLKSLHPKIELYRRYLNTIKQAPSYTWLSITQQTILNLIEFHENPGLLIGETFDETIVIPKLQAANDKVGLFYSYLNKLILSYLFENYTEAVEHIKQVELYKKAATSTFCIPLFYFYKSLSLIAIYSTSQRKEKWSIKRVIHANQKKMNTWINHAPQNHTHKYLIIEAEWLRVCGKINNVAILYDQAIELAKKNSFLNEEALANELAAKYYLAQEKIKIARIYMQEACYCYKMWGADAKVAYLEKNYPQLLAIRNQAAMPSITTTASIPQKSSFMLSSTSTQFLDIASIQKSAHVISSAIVLEDLLKKLILIAIENAGAQKGVLLLRDQTGHYTIEAEGSADTKEIKTLQSLPITEEKLPCKIINYVIQAKEPVVLDDSIKNISQFENDPYFIKQKVKSILCIPLLNKGELTGALYMENNLVEAAFTKDRVEMLALLSVQMAISIDNAKLYHDTLKLNDDLVQLNRAYERFVPHYFLSLLGKKSIVNVALGDQTQMDMTVLFEDIRGFTELSEKMSPAENFKFLNCFLKYIEPVITKYNGFIDKYIGDAIMALFPSNADDAVQCAIEMLQKVKEFNEENGKNAMPAVNIGIGINSGSLMLGTVGGETRMDGTVISDAVNLASRVQYLTKTYNTPLLITEATYQHLRDPARYNMQYVDEVVVRGKTKKVIIYKLNDPSISKQLKS